MFRAYTPIFRSYWYIELTKLKINSNHRLLTMDIKDLYVNIPIDETINITKTLLAKYNDAKTIKTDS